MVSDVEVFDPHNGSWMTGEPMNNPRGYSGAVVIGEKIYIIGGIKDGGEILDTACKHFRTLPIFQPHSLCSITSSFISFFYCNI